MTDAWEAKLKCDGREDDFEGSKNFISKFRPHIILIWSAAQCQIPIEMKYVEASIASFWKEVKDSLSDRTQLSKSWLERSDCPPSEVLAIKTIEYIRTRLSNWPNLGHADHQRLLQYVLDETELRAAWNGTLQPPLNQSRGPCSCAADHDC